MTVPVLTAVTDPRWEARLVSELAGGDHGVEVVRRCVDLADVLAASAAGLGRAVLLTADLLRLDRDALSRLAASGVAVVGLVGDADETAERRLRQLGVTRLLPLDATAADISAAVSAAVEERSALGGRRALGDPHDAVGVGGADPAALSPAPGSGRVIAVWGPAGAPGRSTLAVTLATELAAHHGVLLVDADVYGGVVAALLGILDESPGVAAACRLANNGTLDVPALAELAVELRPRLRVLTGITRSDRWPELRPTAVDVVLDMARTLAVTTVVDCGFCLEQDEELAYDTVAPRRNGATLAVLDAADLVLGVTAADPVGIQRYVRGLAELREAVPGASVLTVVNRLRRGPTGPGDPRKEITHALGRYADVAVRAFVPEDRAGLDAAMAAGRALDEAAPGSPARAAVRDLAAELAGASTASGRRRRAR